MRAGVTLGDGPTSAAAASTRAQALAALRARLTRAGVASPEGEAEWLLLHALGIGRAAYWSEPRAPLRPEAARSSKRAASSRQNSARGGRRFAIS